MLHIELPYISRAGLYLENFTHKGQYLWNASCPICGDMSKGKKKKRFYIYRPGTAAHCNAKCHHCGYSSSFGSFLKLKFPEMYREFVYERYSSTNKNHIAHMDLNEILNIEQPEKTKQLLIDAALDQLTRVEDLPRDHQVVQYLISRQIPESKWNLFYYTETFRAYTNSLVPNKFKDKNKEHPRLVIPYFTEHGKMFAYQGRAMNGEEPKYFTIKLDDRDRIYGLDRLNPSKRIYAVEGPIDPLFLPNSIAVSGSSFDCDTIRALKSVTTLVFDNEPRSREIVRIVKKHIDMGYSVCMFPHSIVAKDINDMILSGISPTQLVEIIEKNTFSGAAAKLHFTAWKLI